MKTDWEPKSTCVWTTTDAHKTRTAVPWLSASTHRPEPQPTTTGTPAAAPDRRPSGAGNHAFSGAMPSVGLSLSVVIVKPPSRQPVASVWNLIAGGTPAAIGPGEEVYPFFGPHVQ